MTAKQTDATQVEARLVLRAQRNDALKGAHRIAQPIQHRQGDAQIVASAGQRGVEPKCPIKTFDRARRLIHRLVQIAKIEPGGRERRRSGIPLRQRNRAPKRAPRVQRTTHPRQQIAQIDPQPCVIGLMLARQPVNAQRLGEPTLRLKQQRQIDRRLGVGRIAYKYRTVTLDRLVNPPRSLRCFGQPMQLGTSRRGRKSRRIPEGIRRPRSLYQVQRKLSLSVRVPV
jgi:hypothetical protein